LGTLQLVDGKLDVGLVTSAYKGEPVTLSNKKNISNVGSGIDAGRRH
jgi:hypothetical protein